MQVTGLARQIFHIKLYAVLKMEKGMPSIPLQQTGTTGRKILIQENKHRHRSVRVPQKLRSLEGKIPI